MLNPVYYAEIKSYFSLHARERMDENFLFMRLLCKLH